MKKFIKILKSISLSQKEKDVLRYKIEQFISFNPIRNEIHVPKKSFYFSIFTFRALGKAVSLVLIALIVVGGTGVSYASTDSLPGDKLYNVKINVNEKIEEKLAFSTEAKVVVQTQKVERRLTEAQKLVEKKDFSPEKKAIVKTNLEKNVNEVTESIEDLKEEGKIEEALNTTSKITPVLEAHKKVLTEQKVEADEKMDSQNENNEDSVASFKMMAVVEESDSLLDSVNEAIKKVEDAEKEIIEKVNEDQKTAEEVTERNTKEVNEKIESLKKENLEISLKDKEDNTGKEGVEVSDSSENTTDVTLMTEITVDPTMGASTNALLKSIEIVSETDAELKVKEAENLLLQAEGAKLLGDFKEALLLSQEAKKIIWQIEEYKKIKNVEAEVEGESTTKIPDATLPIKVEANTKTEVKSSVEVKDVLPLEDIKAEAIKSLEETNASFKNINLSQSTGTHLLQ